MRLPLLTATIATLGLLGCAADPTAPTSADLGLFLARTGSESMPFTQEVPVCSGEFVAIVGTTQVAAAERQGKNGTVASLRLTSRGTGVGMESGARYQFHDSFTLRVSPNAGGGDEVTDVQTLKLIGQGGAPDQHFSVRYRLRVNGAGLQTETVDVTNRCR